MKIRLFSGTSQGEVEDKTNAFIETVIASGAEIEDVQFQYSLSNYTEDNSSLRYDREGFAVCIQYSEG